MEQAKQFTLEVSPELSLIDVQGNRHPVLSAERALDAITSADLMQDVGGTGKTNYLDSVAMAEPEDFAPFLLYYRSNNGKPKKAEIARAARIIARCDVTLDDEEFEHEELDRISGTRAIVFPEKPGAATGAVPFLVSRTVWYNRNRSTVGFPFVDYDYTVEMDLALADINARLMEGTVSAPRK
jgi:hypothetical protein